MRLFGLRIIHCVVKDLRPCRGRVMSVIVIMTGESTGLDEAGVLQQLTGSFLSTTSSYQKSCEIAPR